MAMLLLLLLLLPSQLHAVPVSTESQPVGTTPLPGSSAPPPVVPAVPVDPALHAMIPPQPRVPGVPLRPDGFPAVWTLLPNATEEEIAASLESSLLGLHRGADMLMPLSDPQLRDSREMHSGATEKYPWQNPWYSDYGKFRKNNDPVFDHNMVTNVTAQLGGTAFLHCRVRNLGERPVSWVRRRDWHILTSGVFTYTNDERFQVAHTEGSDDWTLQIKYVQKRDNGTYECQVATGAGTMSHYFNLHIVVPEAFILGSGEYHIGEGSTISLVCIIENSPAPPQYVFWYHNDRMINYDTSRGGVTVSTEPGPKTHSRLIINEATHGDSGNYSCRASNTEPDFIQVFVSKGDKMAAIQRQETSSANVLAPPEVLFAAILVLSLMLSRVLDYSSR